MILSIQGYFDGEKVVPVEKIPVTKQQRVIITFLDDTLQHKGNPLQETHDIQKLSLQGGAFDFLADEPDLYDDYVQQSEQ